MGSAKEAESWLPSQFLEMGKENFTLPEFKKPSFSFPTEFPYEFDSFACSSTSVTSPDESVIGSTETESSDEDDFLAGLTRRLTQQLTLKPEKWAAAGSPESTLSGIGSWPVSNNGSPNGVLSPPATPFELKDDTWDLIYAAAGQVARLKMINEGNIFQEKGFLNSIRAQNQETQLKNQNTAGFYPNQNLGLSVSQMNQYHSQLRNEQMLKQHCASVWARQQQQVNKLNYHQAPPHHSHHHHQSQPQCHSHYQQQIPTRGRCARHLGFSQSAAWPSQAQAQPNHHHHHPHPHPQSCSAMKAVVLGGSGNTTKKECAGTGVFLPRRYGVNNNIPSEPKKKSACSTVLLPAKVVQALNLNFEDMNAQAQPRFNSGFPSDYDLLMARRNAILAQQKRNLRHDEVRLPQEWTY
ncbi:uncharacterized protein LOC126661344 [Mercurialis annua]|uniref:uncharacterized protein LOC126661344 n=1 Tax=Mercurialis annua TaxID=3986 RepID=UPI00215F907C|nr:uncharacterized protein LOC126661344 [Mercurialis annua]